LPREIRLPELAAAPSVASPQTLEDVEKRALLDALHRANGNKKRAAEILGIHRPTLYAKLKRFGLIDKTAADPAEASVAPEVPAGLV